MHQKPFYELFLAVLRELYDGEKELVSQLPHFANAAHHTDLKASLAEALEDTKAHIARLEQIFKQLNTATTGVPCRALRGLFEQGRDFLRSPPPSLICDVGLIVFFQKVAHYEITSYGSARALAQHLHHLNLYPACDFREIADLLEDSGDEAESWDETLTDLAEGGFFSVGLNEAAETVEKEVASHE